MSIASTSANTFYHQHLSMKTQKLPISRDTTKCPKTVDVKLRAGQICHYHARYSHSQNLSF
ncbi:MAG: hypothetical protein KME22_30030 [Hassallia sp. WJT32-NPBG1]|nr:hypothetical protein [Hassallia sp. WJT32-NPBG1]